MQVELRIEGNAALADAIEKSQIDVALVIGHEDRAGAQPVGQLDVVWIASSTFEPFPGQPLPLAVLGPQCVFRKRTIECLEAKRLPHRIAANSPSLDGLWAALLAGLGVTARTDFNLPDGLVSSGSLYGLPALGQMPVTLHRSPHSEGVATDRMAALLSQSLKLALSSWPKRKGRRISRNSVIDISAGLARNHKSRSTVS
jgi:DNA-binding transcriptional LysR family regulator